MARPRYNPRFKLEPELASSILYYDKEEFSSFYSVWQNIENDQDMAPSGQFHYFIKNIKEINDNNKEGREIHPEEYIAKLRQINESEPSRIKREQFDIWLDEVIEKDSPKSFALSEELLDRYCWLCYKDKIDKVDKSDLSFKDKLELRPIRFDTSRIGSSYISISNIIDNEESNKEYTTGSSIIDDFISPVSTNFMVVAARPGVGKSVFLLQQGLQNASMGIPCLFISLEMTGRQLKKRIMNWYKGRVVDKSEWAEIEQEEKFKIIDKNFKIIPTESTNGNVILRQMKEAIEEIKAEIIFLDYLQLVRYAGLDEWGSLRKITFDLKQFAIHNKVLMVSCSQVLRSSNTHGLELESLFGSSTIENDTDIVLGLEATGREKQDNSDEQLLYVKILKNREGLGGKKIKMLVKYISMSFVEA